MEYKRVFYQSMCNSFSIFKEDHPRFCTSHFGNDKCTFLRLIGIEDFGTEPEFSYFCCSWECSWELLPRYYSGVIIYIYTWIEKSTETLIKNILK